MASRLCSFSFLNILTYLSNLGISFLLPMTYNMRLDFFDGYLLEVLEDVRNLAENTEMLIFLIVLLVFNRSKVKCPELWPLLSGQVLKHFKSLCSFFL